MADAKTKKPAQKPTHPRYSEMIATAIETLQEKGGSSRKAIFKFITSKYTVSDNPNVVNCHLKLSLKKGVDNGVLARAKIDVKPKKVVKSTNSKDQTKKAASKKPGAVTTPQETAKSSKKAAKSSEKPKAVKSRKDGKITEKVV